MLHSSKNHINPNNFKVLGNLYHCHKNNPKSLNISSICNKFGWDFITHLLQCRQSHFRKGYSMEHIKYSNKIVMYAISAGYIILSIIAILAHINVMYTLAPYALFSFAVINYTQKRSIEFAQYWIEFELGINEKGHLLKFYIYASPSHNEIPLIPNNEIKTLKVSQYQTPHILSSSRLQAAMANLKYIVCLPCFGTQSVMRSYGEAIENSDISSSNYEQINNEYNIFKNSIIDLIKQNHTMLLEPNIRQLYLTNGHKHRTSLSSFVRS